MTGKLTTFFVWGCCAFAITGSYGASLQSPLFVEAQTRILLGQLEQAVEFAKSHDAELTADQTAVLMAGVYAEIGQGEKALQILNAVDGQDMHQQIKDKKLEIYAQTGNAFELQKIFPAPTHGEQAGLKYFALAAMRKSGNSKYLKALKLKAAQRTDARALSDLAWVYFQIGAYADAIKTLKGDSRTVSVSNAKDRELLALSFQRINQKTKACQALDLQNHSQRSAQEDERALQIIGDLLLCSESSVDVKEKTVRRELPLNRTERSEPTAQASETLTLKPHGAFKSDETRVPYVERFSRQVNRHLPIPEGVGITGSSGVLLGRGNFVLTNRHVVEDGKFFAVKNALGSVSKARVVKVSTEDDLAVLELEQPFPAGQAVSANEIAAARAGGQIYSMGYPLWYLLGTETPSITNGLVSKNSGLNDDPKMFQITAKINKGNSGGPVFDRFGNLIGLTTAKLDTESLRQTEGVDPEGVNFIYQSKEILSFAGRYLVGQGGQASSSQRSLSPEEVYEKRLGSTVMVAVGR